MSYRDDLAAALAKVAVLEQENEELRQVLDGLASSEPERRRWRFKGFKRGGFMCMLLAVLTAPFIGLWWWKEKQWVAVATLVWIFLVSLEVAILATSWSSTFFVSASPSLLVFWIWLQLISTVEFVTAGDEHPKSWSPVRTFSQLRFPLIRDPEDDE